MAYTFVVEDGSMVPNANSYVDVQTATDYLASNIHVAASWASISTLNQQQLLSWATRYLDQRATWNGTQTSLYLANPAYTNLVDTWASIPAPGTGVPQQSLRWPRSGVYDVDGNPIESNVIPPALIAATVEMARYLIVNDRSSERPQDGLTELKADTITLKFLPDYTLPIVPTEIGYIIRGLGTIASGRTNFSKITRV